MPVEINKTTKSPTKKGSRPNLRMYHGAPMIATKNVTIRKPLVNQLTLENGNLDMMYGNADFAEVERKFSDTAITLAPVAPAATSPTAFVTAIPVASAAASPFAAVSAIVTASTAATAATTMTTTAAVAASSSAATATRTLFGFAHPNGTAIQFLAIEFTNRVHARFAAAERDKRKPTGFARFPILGKVEFNDGFKLGQEFTELHFSGIVGKVSQV